MSLLNQLFNRGLLGQKCKTCLTLAVSRIKLLQNKRDGQLKIMRKEIAQFLHAGQEAIARIRVEHIIREQNIWAAYEILEMFCEFVLARVPILESQRECPSELREAVASIIFAAPRCSDLPDLLQVRNLFAAKYGKEFIAAASELRPDTSVNRTIIEKLSPSAPSAEVKLNTLKEIAREYKINWDSSKTEAEFFKNPEDLLEENQMNSDQQTVCQDSRKQQAGFDANMRRQNHGKINGLKQKATPSSSIFESDTQKHPPALEHPITSSKLGYQSSTVASNSSLLAVNNSKPSAKDHNIRPITEIKGTGPLSTDALDKARSAIAAAERATAAAHAAAELVNRSSAV